MVQAAAVLTRHGRRVNRALGAVELMPGSVEHELESPLRMTSAHFASRHRGPLWLTVCSVSAPQVGARALPRFLLDERAGNPLT
jgi:hypothetical protein